MNTKILLFIFLIIVFTGCRKERLSDEDKNKLYDKWMWVQSVTPAGNITNPGTEGYNLHFDFLETDAYAVFYDELLVEKGHFKPTTASGTQELVLKFKSSHFLRSKKSDYFKVDENFVFISKDTIYIIDQGGDGMKRVIVRE
jgi:hypothetical protein